MKTTKNILLVIALFIFLFSCGKKDTPPIGGGPDPIETAETYGLYVLSEGSFGQNNTMLTYFDMETQTATTDFYEKENGNGLGDTGNDMVAYGGKLYIAMNVSNYVEIADLQTAKSLGKIQLLNEFDAPRNPRQMAAGKGFVFVSCQDGTVQVIDTATLGITHVIEVGTNPEGMAVVGNKLYVANSGGFNFPDYDSTLSVIDLNTLAEVEKITVGLNPINVTSDGEKNIYVSFAGNYGDVPGGISKVSVANHSVIATSQVAGAKMSYYDNSLFVVAGAFGAQTVQMLHASDLSVVKDNFITDGTIITSPYALNIDQANGTIYVGDQLDYVSPGSVFAFDVKGKKQFSFSVAPGMNPNTIVVLRKR